MSISYFIQRILWVDCIGALLTGIAMLSLSGWVSSLYGLPHAFVIGHAFVHLAYGTYSFWLASRKRRAMTPVLLLVFANAAWACFCFVFAAIIIGNATAFAVYHFVLEGIYVGGLAIVEWKQRQLLVTSENL